MRAGSQRVEVRWWRQAYAPRGRQGLGVPGQKRLRRLSFGSAGSRFDISLCRCSFSEGSGEGAPKQVRETKAGFELGPGVTTAKERNRPKPIELLHLPCSNCFLVVFSVVLNSHHQAVCSARCPVGLWVRGAFGIWRPCRNSCARARQSQTTCHNSYGILVMAQ